MQYTVLFILISMSFNSCLKEETPVNPPIPGSIATVQIEIGYPYINQVYYNCTFNNIVKSNTKYEWDLSFESSKKGFHVLLNTARGIFSSKQHNREFNEVISSIGLQWNWDAPSGNLDSTAIGVWQNKKETYIIDRQFDENGKHLGFKKIIFHEVNEHYYTFKFANLDGREEVIYKLEKKDSLNFIHFSFENGGRTLTLEPNKNNWDLLFSNHYHKFSNLDLPFVLTQVLINKYNGVLVAEDNGNNFVNISLKDTSHYSFSNAWDVIGYDWKIRNNQDNSFTIDIQKSYIIKTRSGLFYKLRFVDFYNDKGVKGYPKFEIQKL